MLALIKIAAIAFCTTSNTRTRRQVHTMEKVPSPIMWKFGRWYCDTSQQISVALAKRAMATIAQAANVNFKEGEGGMVFEALNCDACNVWSFNNTVNIGSCHDSEYQITHEIMHKLGFHHEMFHDNKNTYFELDTQTMPTRWLPQWVATGTNIFSVSPFDICSVMMYNPFSPVWNNSITLTSLGWRELAECLPGSTLSNGDKAALIALYGPFKPSDTYAHDIANHLLVAGGVVCLSGLFAASLLSQRAAL